MDVLHISLQIEHISLQIEHIGFTYDQASLLALWDLYNAHARMMLAAAF